MNYRNQKSFTIKLNIIILIVDVLNSPPNRAHPVSNTAVTLAGYMNIKIDVAVY